MTDLVLCTANLRSHPPIRFKPQSKRQVVPGFVGQEIRTKFGVIALSQNVRSQVARTCELLHVVTIAFDIPFQFGEGQIMGLKREEPQATPRTGEHGHQSFLVILRRRGDGDSVQVDFVLLVQDRPLAADLYQIIPYVRHNAQEINVAGGAGDSVELHRDEPTAAMQLNVFAEAGVDIGEKGTPRLRRLFNARHTVTARL